MASKKKGISTKGKKKEAKARATITAGKGVVRINSRSIETIPQEYIRQFIREPIDLCPHISQQVDIEVDAMGGGFVGQAVAARSAIAKALIEYAHDERLKKKFLAYDRLLLVDDPRRVEPKKPLGTKARKRKQLSKR
ncbi:30S ribosomal protein S9 [uncultured archaeon]|nr:30S ribosomal protein S9 [uncultured archaeon]